MSTTYAQRQTTAQKKEASSASSIFDASSQSESLQRKADMANNAAQRAEAPRPNNTGMPDNLKAGIESLSGFSMDDVRVHYNSSKPATVQALAYTQGTDIHIAPGQEKHLPHEAWHVAQQMAGRVSPTTNINGMPVNDNAALEHEADVMGEKAVQCKRTLNEKNNSFSLSSSKIQRKISISPGKKMGDYHLCYPQFLDGTDLNEPANNLVRDTCISIIKNMVEVFLGNKCKINFNGFTQNKEDDCWDEIWIKDQRGILEKYAMPIKIQDFFEDCKDENRDNPEEFKAIGVDANACVVQALGSLGICPNASEVGDGDVNVIASAWHEFCENNNINYQNDAGAYILCSKIGFQLVDHFYGMQLTEFLKLKHPPKLLVSLWNEKSRMGHSIAMINGGIVDEQKIVVGRLSEYTVKYVYICDTERLNPLMAKDLSRGGETTKSSKTTKRNVK